VRVGSGEVVFYRFALEDGPCSDDWGVITPCPLWRDVTDDPVEGRLGPIGVFDPHLPFD
jgi:hypothetical protein